MLFLNLVNIFPSQTLQGKKKFHSQARPFLLQWPVSLCFWSACFPACLFIESIFRILVVHSVLPASQHFFENMLWILTEKKNGTKGLANVSCFLNKGRNGSGGGLLCLFCFALLLKEGQNINAWQQWDCTDNFFFFALLSSQHSNDLLQRQSRKKPPRPARTRAKVFFFFFFNRSYGRYEEPLNGSVLFMGSNEVRSILVCGTGLH